MGGWRNDEEKEAQTINVAKCFEVMNLHDGHRQIHDILLPRCLGGFLNDWEDFKFNL